MNEIHNTGFFEEPQFGIAYIGGDPLYLAGKVIETWGTEGRGIADYAIGLTWKTGNKYWGSMPADAPDGKYEIQFYSRAGDDPALSDLPNVLGTQILEWPVFTMSTLAAAVTSLQTAVAALEPTTGSGSVVVSDTYDGGDYTVKTAGGAGIDEATILAYLTSDYEAGNLSQAFIKALTVTISTGQWRDNLDLDPGDYTLRIVKQGVYQPQTQTLTVTA